MGTYVWNILYSKILPTKSRAQRRRPAAQAAPSQAVHWNLATGPYPYLPQPLIPLPSFNPTLSFPLLSKGLSVIIHFKLHIFPNPRFFFFFLHIQREFHCNILPTQKLSRKQHIFGKRDNSLVSGINHCRCYLI